MVEGEKLIPINIEDEMKSTRDCIPCLQTRYGLWHRQTDKSNGRRICSRP